MHMMKKGQIAKVEKGAVKERIKFIADIDEDFVDVWKIILAGLVTA